MSGTAYPELFGRLAAPVNPADIKTREGGRGRRLSYITARTVMNWLDSVLGPENWEDAYEVARNNATICRLTLTLPDGRRVTKEGIGVTAESVGEDAEKGGEADALKRAAVKFGIARELYQDGVVDYSDAPEDRPKTTPVPRDAVRTAQQQASSRPEPRDDTSTPERPPAQFAAPRTGKSLFAWTKEQEQKHDVGLLKYLNNWGKLQDFPGRMIDWDADQVAQAYGEAMRKIQSIQPARSEVDYEDAPIPEVTQGTRSDPRPKPLPEDDGAPLDPEIYGRVAQTARDLFPWIKSLDAKNPFKILPSFNAWAKEQGFHWKTAEWDDEQVEAGKLFVLGLIEENLGIGSGKE